MSSTANTVLKRVASPCIHECCLAEDNICLGCHRSLREICDWSDATDEQRLEILVRCVERRRERDKPVSRQDGTDVSRASPVVVLPIQDPDDTAAANATLKDR